MAVIIISSFWEPASQKGLLICPEEAPVDCSVGDSAHPSECEKECERNDAAEEEEEAEKEAASDPPPPILGDAVTA